MSIQQIVLHPTVDRTLKYASTTVGREKVYRAIQYFARFLAWHLKRKGGVAKETIQQINSLKSTLALSRKLMRIGKPVEHLQQAANALNRDDGFAKFTTVGRQLCYAMYLSQDTLVWAHNAGVYKFQQIKKIQESSNRFWVIGIVISIIHGLYKLQQISSRHDFFERASKIKIVETSDSNAGSEVVKLKRERKAVIKQLILDILDFTIPATALGYLHFEEGVVGLAGLITSIMGIQSQWKKVNGSK